MHCQKVSCQVELDLTCQSTMGKLFQFIKLFALHLGQQKGWTKSSLLTIPTEMEMMLVIVTAVQQTHSCRTIIEERSSNEIVHR